MSRGPRRDSRRAGTARLLQAAGLSEERTLEDRRRIAFYDPAGCFDAAGNLLPIAEMPPEIRTAVASVKVVKCDVTPGEGSADEIREVRFCDKVRALESLAEALSPAHRPR